MRHISRCIFKCEFIADNFTNNIRELEGAINRLIQYCLTCELEINLENTKEALAALISTINTIKHETTDYYSEIIGVVADFYGIKQICNAYWKIYKSS